MTIIKKTIKKEQIQKEKLIMKLMIEQNDFHLYDTTTMKTTATTMPTTTPLPLHRHQCATAMATMALLTLEL